MLSNLQIPLCSLGVQYMLVSGPALRCSSNALLKKCQIPHGNEQFKSQPSQLKIPWANMSVPGSNRLQDWRKRIMV